MSTTKKSNCEAELRLANKFINDLWQLVKQYYSIQTDDTYWDALVRDAGDLIEKYAGLKLSKKLVFAFIENQKESYRDAIQ